MVERAAQALIKEYIGLNVPINSQQEADEILLDLNTLMAGEEFAELFSDTNVISIFIVLERLGWQQPSLRPGTSPGGSCCDGKRARMTRILNILQQVDPTAPVKPELKSELDMLPQQNQRFTGLLNEITTLTHQLEGRYRGILPFSVETTPLRRLATRLHLRRDPARVLWQHNDRYERKMLELRRSAAGCLEFYFSLNKGAAQTVVRADSGDSEQPRLGTAAPRSAWLS